ncbi:hypothetical protein DES37_101141 [Mangrovibacter plantisponsor]|uniref:Uncharacterized protein n=1 Tax=Mangrovibacter plantisponsor TaxID=451513 RepID=A0A317Q7G1_9ENTR|nr:hypothetical protein DES37_101141 [Mangrovibacter plantisponsor]
MTSDTYVFVIHGGTRYMMDKPGYKQPDSFNLSRSKEC